MRTSIQVALFIIVLGLRIIPGTALAIETGKSDPPFWWRVEMRVTVTGDYRFLDETDDEANNGFSGFNGFSGRYAFTMVLLGSLQPDEGDYIFFQAFSDAARVSWLETSGEGENRKRKNYSLAIKPDMTLNYVFKEKGKLLFDFDIQSVEVPLGETITPFPAMTLLLPCSAGDETVQSKTSYDKGIINGSNAVVLGDRDLYEQPEIQRNYHWAWKKTKAGWLNRHKVNVQLKIIRLKKDKTTIP